MKRLASIVSAALRVSLVSLAFSARCDTEIYLNLSDLTWVGSGTEFYSSWTVAEGGSFVSATGGTTSDYTENGTNFTAHIFTESGTFSVVAGGLVEYLVVAGGGGGVNGGGGAGGLLSGAMDVETGDITVTVGGGGLGAVTDKYANGGDGANSVFGSLTAVGGGGGGEVGIWQAQANSGGSGGGGGAWDAGIAAGGAGTTGQGFGGGNNGGFKSPPYPSGGGGGAGGIGGSATSKFSPGAAGAGFSSSISGTTTTYAAGGAGACYQNWPAVSNAAANTGNGGNGAGTLARGGNGGSGIVIIRYRRN